ncbi:MAG: thioredoxin domain-containing protein [Ilumatobacteraceae bacterium]
MINAIVALAVVLVVGVVALVARRRRVADAPTQVSWNVPQQIDPRDLDVADQDWMVIVFTSATCHVCADVAQKARVLASREVFVAEIEYAARRDLHEKYGIDAVPTLLIADRDGVVRRHVLGPVTATDLWADVARVRDPDRSVSPGDCSPE